MYKMMLLVVGLPVSLVAHTNGLEKTLSQSGYDKVAQCTPPIDGATTVAVFHNRDLAKDDSYVLFTSIDEDSKLTQTYLEKTTRVSPGHDDSTYYGQGFELNVVEVGESPTLGRMFFSSKDFALDIWLKTYGFGLSVKTKTLRCEQL